MARPKSAGPPYFQYGTWRREVMRRHPETVQADLPGTASGSRNRRPGLPCGITGLNGPVGPPRCGFGWLIPGGYAAAVALGGIAISRGEPIREARVRQPSWRLCNLSWGGFHLTTANRRKVLIVPAIRGGVCSPNSANRPIIANARLRVTCGKGCH